MPAASKQKEEMKEAVDERYVVNVLANKQAGRRIKVPASKQVGKQIK